MMAEEPLEGADIRENDIVNMSPALIDTLLKDHTTGLNITWSTHDYEALGAGYEYSSQIKAELISGERGHILTPRIRKGRDVQTERKKEKAEIFTPAWMCNSQLNIIDRVWFARKDVFNIEHEDHSWETLIAPISFPKGKTWKDYVKDTRMEITCGEGPYLASRYDATTGAFIPLPERIGIIDRKLRVVSENTSSTGEWLKWAQEAFMNTYGFEWQGDSLFLARESMLYTFLEYYRAKFGTAPLGKSVRYIAYIISWNLWQMDGLKGVVPDSCGEKPDEQLTLFGPPDLVPCEGCRTGDIHRHNGTYCLIRDWHAKGAPGEGPGKKIRFVDLMK